MALQNGFNKVDVNLVCEDIVANKMRSCYFKILSEMPDWLEEHGISDLLEQPLFNLICVGKHNARYARILTQFVDYAMPDVITDSVFNALMKLPKGMRDDVVVCLSHKELSPGQLKHLCATNVTFECYYILAIYQFQHSECSNADLQETLCRFKSSIFGEQLPYLLRELLALPSDNIEKRTTIVNMMSANPEYQQ